MRRVRCHDTRRAETSEEECSHLHGDFVARWLEFKGSWAASWRLEWTPHPQLRRRSRERHQTGYIYG